MFFSRDGIYMYGTHLSKWGRDGDAEGEGLAAYILFGNERIHLTGPTAPKVNEVADLKEPPLP